VPVSAHHPAVVDHHVERACTQVDVGRKPNVAPRGHRGQVAGELRERHKLLAMDLRRECAADRHTIFTP
jgi:hypothetical protein